MCLCVCGAVCVFVCAHACGVFAFVEAEGGKGFVWEDKAWDAKTLKNKEEIVSYVLFLTLYHIEFDIFYYIFHMFPRIM